jgi:imidazolonepropionase
MKGATVEAIDLIVRAEQVLVMPESPECLHDYDPGCDWVQRDRTLLGAIDDGCVYIGDGAIQWVGAWAKRPQSDSLDSVPVFNCRLLTPGWVDCHTHSVFAGERAAEFVLRNAGRPYVEILEAGGGILNTVKALRGATLEELTDSLVERGQAFLRRGVTTLEVKTGYGLSTRDEEKSLLAIAAASPRVPSELVPCFLGAHAVPLAYRDRREAYVDLVCREMIPRFSEQNLAGYCDVFCDRGAFSVSEARRVLETGQEHGMIARIHADELTDAGAARLACDVGAASADHLEWTSDDVVEEMARKNVIGVLMPAVNLFLGTTDHVAPARKLLQAGGEIALATDYNPGSAMTMDIALMTTLGCTLYGLTPGESLRGVTIGAAKALRREDIGRLRVGARADLCCLDVSSFESIPYHMGENHVSAVFCRGELVHSV